MGILKIDDVPPPLGAGGGDGERPANASEGMRTGGTGFGTSDRRGRGGIDGRGGR